MTATFMNAFYEPLAHAQKKPWVVPSPPLVKCIAYYSTSWCYNVGNVAAGKGYDHVPTSPDYPRSVRSEIDWDMGGWSRGMTRPACKQFLAYSRYAGIVLLEEKIVSNILIYWYNMCVKAIINIALACK